MIMRYNISLRHKYKSSYSVSERKKHTLTHQQPKDLFNSSSYVGFKIAPFCECKDVSVCFLTLNKASVSCKVPLISLACVFVSKNNKLHNPSFCFHVHSWSVQDWTESRKCTGKTRVPGPRCLFLSFLSGTFCDGEKRR